MTIDIACNFCGGKTFSPLYGRPSARCEDCGSVERTRITKLFLDHVAKIGPGTNILHIHPEPDLLKFLSDFLGNTYTPIELKPRKSAKSVRNVSAYDVETLGIENFDVVIHNHVLQEVEGNYTIFVQKIHSLLKSGGIHLFSVPISSGFFEESGDPKISPEERKIRFGRERHRRRFGRSDFANSLGPIFNIPSNFSLTDYFLPETLIGAGVPENNWRLSSNLIFAVRR